MIAQEQAIEDQYKSLLESQKNRLLQKKMQELQGVQDQQGQVNNQYQELYNGLNQKKADTENQYKTMYTGLDNQAEQGKQKFYGDRNQTAVNNSQKVQQIRDYMARNNLLQSGESVDAQLRNNTDYSNNMGQIATNETGFMKDLGDTRNKYQMQEQSAYNDIGNQRSASEREQAQKLLELTNRMNLINTNATSEEQALEDDVNYRKLNDLNTLRERLRQEEMQRQEAESQYQRQLAMQREQQAAAQRAAVAKTSASKTSSKATTNKQPYESSNQKNIYDFYNDKKVSYGEKMDTLSQVSSDQGYSQEDRDYADRMKQALRAAQYYDAAYANYRGGY